MKAIDFREDFPAAGRRRRLLFAALVWFAVCLVAGAPAQLLALLLRALTPQLQLQNVDGGFWRGAAAQAFWQQDGKVIALGRLQWQLNPWSLLWLHPSAHVSAQYGEQFIDTRVRLSPLGGIALRDTSAAVPVRLLGNWLPLPARGLLVLKLAAADFSRRQLRAASGDIYWQQAQWQWGSQWLSLGDYRCTLRFDALGEMHCAVQGQGALAGGGDIGIDFNNNTWSAGLTLRLAASLPQEFRQTITAMLAAQPDAQGQLQLRKNGHW